MAPAVLAVVAAAASLGGFAQGFSGFGSTLVAMPLLGAMLDMRAAVPLAGLMAIGVNIALLVRLHAHVQRGPLGRLLAASLPGMAVGALLLDVAPTGLLKLLLGASVLLFVLSSLRSRASTAPSPAGTATAGLLAGCLGVCIGVNGPPVVAWAARQPWNRDAIKATMIGYFLAAGVGSAGIQAAQGLITPQVLGLLALSLPLLEIGQRIGTACCGRLDDIAFRRAILWLLAVTGAALLCQAGAGA